MPSTIPYLDFLTETFAGCKIIHIVRNGLDVALDVGKKEWYSNKQLRRPICSGLLYRKYMSKKDLETYYITWWVKKGEDEMFLKMSDFAKGLYSWRRYFKLSEQQVKKFVSCHQNQYKEIRFENMLRNPKAVIDDLSCFLHARVSCDS